MEKLQIKNLQVKFIYTSQIRTIHQSSVLHVENEKKQLTDQVPEVDTKSLLDGLEEMKKYSEQMTVSEYIEKTTSSVRQNKVIIVIIGHNLARSDPRRQKDHQRNRGIHLRRNQYKTDD